MPETALSSYSHKRERKPESFSSNYAFILIAQSLILNSDWDKGKENFIIHLFCKIEHTAIFSCGFCGFGFVFFPGKHTSQIWRGKKKITFASLALSLSCKFFRAQIHQLLLKSRTNWKCRSLSSSGLCHNQEYSVYYSVCVKKNQQSWMFCWGCFFFQARVFDNRINLCSSGQSQFTSSKLSSSALSATCRRVFSLLLQSYIVSLCADCCPVYCTCTCCFTVIFSFFCKTSKFFQVMPFITCLQCVSYCLLLVLSLRTDLMLSSGCYFQSTHSFKCLSREAFML